MEIYNPTKPVTLMDVIRDVYWNSKVVRVAVDSVFCVVGVVTISLLAVVIG